MVSIILVVLVLHVSAAVFWAGSTFAVARLGGDGAERLFRPQMGAATIAILTGGVLWSWLQSGAFGLEKRLLAIGAVSAVGAAAVQAAFIGGMRHRVAAGGRSPDDTARRRMLIAERVASALLLLAIAAMTAARHA